MTVAQIEPVPVVPAGPLGDYTPEFRAAYFVQGISPAHGRLLHKAGIGPDNVIEWTDSSVGIGLSDYPRMARIAAAGISPTAYVTYKTKLRQANTNSADETIIGYVSVNMTPTDAARWETARHRKTCNCFRAPVTSGTCSCRAVTASYATALIRHGKNPGWLIEALDAGCPSVSVALSVAQTGIPLAMVRRIAARRSAYEAVHASAMKRVWSEWVDAAGSPELAEALALSGSPLTDAPKWNATGLVPTRCALLCQAGFRPDEALTPDVVDLTEEDVAVLAALLMMNEPDTKELAYI